MFRPTVKPRRVGDQEGAYVQPALRPPDRAPALVVGHRFATRSLEAVRDVALLFQNHILPPHTLQFGLQINRRLARLTGIALLPDPARQPRLSVDAALRRECRGYPAAVSSE